MRCAILMVCSALISVTASGCQLRRPDAADGPKGSECSTKHSAVPLHGKQAVLADPTSIRSRTLVVEQAPVVRYYE